MAKQFFCSNCGTPLKWSRKSLKNRQVIVDLIDPHECNAENVVNITDSNVPTVDRIKIENEQFEDKVKRASSPDFEFEPDRRAKEHKRVEKSSAPNNLLSQVRDNQLPSSKMEQEFKDLDEAINDD